MSTLTKRSTIYFDPVLHQALWLKAAETSRSASEIVNDAVRESLGEDAEDLAAFEARKNEPLIRCSQTSDSMGRWFVLCPVLGVPVAAKHWD